MNIFASVHKVNFAGALIVGVMLLAACSGEQEKILPGKRIPIMLGNSEIAVDVSLAGVPILLPKPNPNNGFPQSGGFVDHANYHLALPDQIKRKWSVSLGSFDSDDGEVTQPVIAEGRIYSVDHKYRVQAIDNMTGKRVWQLDLEVPKADREAIGGGIAYDQGRIFVTTAYRMLYALNADDGTILWQTNLESPTHSAPSVAGNRLVVITLDNQARGFDLETGELMWRHFGISEVAGLRGGASPAISGNLVVFPYSSGEVFALRLDNGRELWSESLASLQPINALASLADIKANPVIDRGAVYVIGHAGRMMAIDASSGVRAWERNIGGVEMPWAAGEHVFVLGLDASLFALTRKGGKARWRTYLPQFEDMEDMTGRILWKGPVLAGDRLLLANNLGEVLSISPYDGAVLGEIDVGGSIRTLPIIADNHLYLLKDDGTLLAYH
ncbi:MAG: PQQ-binding-like beta-propeller repeat protein [Alphaproteobacteria bacterium]